MYNRNKTSIPQFSSFSSYQYINNLFQIFAYIMATLPVSNKRIYVI